MAQDMAAPALGDARASQGGKAVRTRRSRKEKDPEGRMSLGSHLKELRNRMLWCAAAVIVTSVVGWIFYQDIWDLLYQPFERAKAQGVNVELNMGTVGSPLNTKIQISAYVGLILAMPMFLYQAWMFIMPGLHKNERRYALGFFGAGIPLFFIGALAGYWVMDKAVPIFMQFSPENASNFVSFPEYLRLFIKTMLAFGLAFVMPVVLVLLNFIGILSARSMLKAWRWVVLLCFAFTAVMVPTPDPFTMIFMTIPMISLYFAAVGVSAWNDRRRGRRAEEELDDDQASTIDDAPEAIEAPSRLDEDDRL